MSVELSCPGVPLAMRLEVPLSVALKEIGISFAVGRGAVSCESLARLWTQLQSTIMTNMARRLDISPTKTPRGSWLPVGKADLSGAQGFPIGPRHKAKEGRLKFSLSVVGKVVLW
jgi:hypothetical protein